MVDVKQRQKEVLKQFLPYINQFGWSMEAIEVAVKNEAIELPEYHLLFPKGIADLLSFYTDSINQEMLEHLEAVDLKVLKIRERVTLAIMTRLRLMREHREAIQKGLDYFLKPTHFPEGLSALYKTVDAIWYGIGDQSTDFSFYTKRMTLAAIYAATLKYWLKDQSPEFQNTAMFLDRQLEKLMVIPKLKQKIKNFLKRKK